MKLFIDSGQPERNRSPRAARHHRRHHDQPVAARQGGRRLPGVLKKICQIVQGTDQRRSRRDRRRGHDSRGPRSRDHRRAHRRQSAVHAGTASRRARRCRREGMRVNVTLVFSPTQALIAAKVGATYVSPFVGRLDDIATSGMGLVGEIVEILRELPVHDRGARRLDPPPDAHRRSGAHRRRHLHLSRGGDRVAVQASAHRHRARDVPEGLGEGSGGEGLVQHCPAWHGTQASRRAGAARGARRRRRPAAAPARSRQADRARAHRSPVRSRHVSRRSTSSSRTAAATSGWTTR